MEAVKILPLIGRLLTLLYFNDVSGVKGCIDLQCAQNDFEWIL